MDDRFRFRAWGWGGKMLYDDRPGDCLVWKNNGQDIEAIMQSTGLKDKNGKLIYEGDVVRIATPPCQIQTAVFIGKVFYSWAAWAIEIIQVERWEKFRVSPPDKGTIIYTLNLIGREWERIGNIYENPEMIGG